MLALQQLWRAAESIPGAHVAGSCTQVPASVSLCAHQSSQPGRPLLGPGFVLYTRTNRSQERGCERLLKLETSDTLSLTSLPQTREEPKALNSLCTMGPDHSTYARFLQH